MAPARPEAAAEVLVFTEVNPVRLAEALALRLAARWVYLAADQRHAWARHLLGEMRITLRAEEMAEARKQADAFRPVKRSGANPRERTS